MPGSRSLPTGTVTFLFTDIEGSTRLVQELGSDYAQLLAEHCEIMREAIGASGGTEVGTEGDSFFAVFPSPSGGVAAAARAQQALAARAWPGGHEVRVRMGLHTGDGTLGGDDYIGLDVHRAARIAAAGHGGQVLLSGTTRALVEKALPVGATLRDLGAHRLKDLANPERLFQLELPGLPADFPALRSLDVRANNLPVQLTSFIGRASEVAAVGELLDRSRLVTLTGPGGTGKTRLALQVAAERLTRYPDGAFFVELAPIIDPALVPSAVAAALSLRPQADEPPEAAVTTHLRDLELLLVLDNFEQVTHAAPFVSDLLRAAADLRVLVTSRAVLHVHGEQEYSVPPMQVPPAGDTRSPADVAASEAVQLFAERAMAVRPGFTLTDDVAPTVVEIVERLDGLPLAIELAAAKVRLLEPAEIRDHLGNRLGFLAGGPRDLPARQQTLRQAIDWSHDLLTAGEQAFLRRLAVFSGGWSPASAEAVALAPDAGVDALEGLAALLDQSFIRRGEALQEARFEMLETIREYAREQLTTAGEAAVIRRRHAEHFAAIAHEAEPQLTASAEVIERISLEHDNFRAALAWAIEADVAGIGLPLAHDLWRFWQQRGYFREGRAWFDRLLALPSAADPSAARAKGLTGAAGIAYWQNDYSAATAWYAEAEQIIRGLGDRAWLADAVYNSGTTAALVGDMETVTRKLEEGAAIGRELGDDRLVGRFVEYEGYMAFMGDDLDRARGLLEDSLALAERHNDRMWIATAHHTVAQVARLQGRLGDARDHYRAALEFGHELGDAAALTEPLQGLAAVAIKEGHAALGARLLGANAAIRERLGGGPPPEWLRLGDPLAEARDMLPPDEYERAWQEGRALSVDEAVQQALADS
jgi:predicted ATPase/class 3 adenylate cyclase